MVSDVQLLKRNLERFEASKSNMKAKSKKYPNDKIVQEWTAAEIKRLDEAIHSAKAQLDAVRAEL